MELPQMEKPKSLQSLFKEKIFRIPDYQRGYSWQLEQFKAFWEDLIALPQGRSHYTGVLTLKQVADESFGPSDNEFWLLDDHSYHLYHVVDGQQRLTTFIIFIQCFAQFFQALPENEEKGPKHVEISGTLSLQDLQESYLFKINPKGAFRTYKFGYTQDNPSYEFMRFRILKEAGAGQIQETFYTLNLDNATRFFTGQLAELHEREGLAGLRRVFDKLTKRFLFNEYVIEDDFDVFVAFETMNNRGKKLSDLELLKNRLIYLTTLYPEEELGEAGRKSLRDSINNAWKEVYHQLGRNAFSPLNDDDYLRAHWIVSFKYSRRTGRDYAKFLLDEHFIPKKIHQAVERDVPLLASVERRSETDLPEQEEADVPEEASAPSSAKLSYKQIREFAESLKSGVVHWFDSFYPENAASMSTEERLWIDRLNRLGMAYFRPLVMVVLKKVSSEPKRVELYKRIERYIFLSFRLTAARSNRRNSEFLNLARAVNHDEEDLDDVMRRLEQALAYAFNESGNFLIEDFHSLLLKKFKEGTGYYGWAGLRYMLYEYEQSLLSESRQKKVDWSDLLKSESDKLSIEHIYPQTPIEAWERPFAAVPLDLRPFYGGSLGNLVLLSMSINSSLQNDSFEDKKKPKFDREGKKIRNGYSDGSHSEIEVAGSSAWGADEIRSRGLKMLRFMEGRWGFEFKDDAEREKLLFLNARAT
jgi:hypothetical protein